MSNQHGGAIDGMDHLRQSVINILGTPLGSRVMRRDYGSNLANLIDANVSQLTIAQIYAATADALDKWEPRLKVERVAFEATDDDLAAGRIVLSIVGQYLPDGRQITLAGVVV